MSFTRLRAQAFGITAARHLALFALVLTLFAGSAIITETRSQTEVVPKDRSQLSLTFAPIVRDSAPAVVNVYSQKVVQNRSLQWFSENPLFKRFFGERGLGGTLRERVQNSLGSGVIVSEDGYIVTNHHVVDGGTDIRVVLLDKREYEAEVVLDDERTDLTILKVKTDGESLPYLKFTDSDDLEVGDLVLAIGNPFGIGQTVTSGIVSALARTDVGVSDYQFFIQTDAAINPGNSGGALVDMGGHVVGINTAIYSRSGGSHGVGFAIPANMVRFVVDSARNGTAVQRPWLGAQLQDVTSDIAESLGFDRPKGALVQQLHRKSPLNDVGILPGDVLLSIDGRKVSAPEEFTYRFATKQVGSVVRVRYLQNGREKSADITLEVPPNDPPSNQTLLSGNRNPFAGAVVANLSPALADELRLSNIDEGVIIVKLQRGNARRLGFKAGDIILSVARKEISTVDDIKSVTSNSRDLWEISIKRGERIINTNIEG
jgi:Do/DeqQ family serine protease